ncbi:hypothetical protein WJX74_000319 [Apatococcus lobatus]|uniref:F-box domain-containing protein n=1 Tax=Apatococcus lobatus TaxID=904363 RepID=A0AAW1RAN1_9CHLO
MKPLGRPVKYRETPGKPTCCLTPNTAQSSIMTERHCALGDLEKLPRDVVVKILSNLAPAELAVTEGTCQSIRGLVVDSLLWQRLCCLENSAIGASISSLVPEDDIDHDQQIFQTMGSTPFDQLSSEPIKLEAIGKWHSSAWKLLCYRLTAPNARDSLLAQPLYASSTDNAEETVENVAWPMKGRRTGQIWPGVARYWSSKGNAVEHSDEQVLLRLAHPACLVREVQIQAFKAEFQAGAPVYAPQRVSFVMGGVDCFEANGRPRPSPNILAAVSHQSQQHSTPQLAMQKNAHLQRFEIPPTPCFGGLLQVNLHGRTQRQSDDDLWYTCIAHIRVIGTPIYNFVPQYIASHPISRQQSEEGMLDIGTQSSPTADDGVDKDCGSSAAGDEESDVALASEPVHAPGSKGIRLQLFKQDPLEAAGGLHQVSECARHVTGAQHPHSHIIQDLVAMHAQQQQVPAHLNQAFQQHLAQQLHNALNADEDGEDGDDLQVAYDDYIQDAGQQ